MTGHGGHDWALFEETRRLGAVCGCVCVCVCVCVCACVRVCVRARKCVCQPEQRACVRARALAHRSSWWLFLAAILAALSSSAAAVTAPTKLLSRIATVTCRAAVP